MRDKKKGESGFTLIETIAVLILIGIVAAVAVVRWGGDETSLISQAEVIKAHLRYAQARSMNFNSIYGIQSTGGAYFLFNDGNTANKIALPGEAGVTVDVSGNNLVLDNFILSFDFLGVPHQDAAATDGQELVNVKNIIVSGNGVSKTISVTPNTGYIP